MCLPVGGVTYKIEAAALAGIKTVIIPKSNMGDVLIEDEYKDKIRIIPVSNIEEVLEYSLVGGEKEGLIATLKKFASRTKFNIPIPETKPISAV